MHVLTRLSSSPPAQVKGDADLEAGLPPTGGRGGSNGLMAVASAKRREVVSQVRRLPLTR